ncbi:hypothetical protein fugu_005978 [Takifugu bimaculatus]|uniref:Uncharacterized protein n=1 Tax=Takifugu bimaculatus TaxID=433685 RepID=A0A4Z2B6N4_9TELE|nr:hypothetical protein fugu_005978 [Takifugu bimaculatus]
MRGNLTTDALGAAHAGQAGAPGWSRDRGLAAAAVRLQTQKRGTAPIYRQSARCAQSGAAQLCALHGDPPGTTASVAFQPGEELISISGAVLVLCASPRASEPTRMR